MNFADSDRSGSWTRRILGELAPSPKRRGQVELLLLGVRGRYEEFAPRNRFEPRIHLRVSAQVH